MKAAAGRITGILAGRGIIPEGDVELYQYGIESGMVIVGNLAASLIFGMVAGRLGNILVFLFFYGTLRSFCGGIHCKSRAGCFTASMMLLFIPAYLCDWAAHIPTEAVIIVGVATVAAVMALSPVGSPNKSLDMAERKHYGKISRYTAGWQVCALTVLYYMDRLDYFYAGYSGFLLTALLLIIGKMTTKHYT